MGEKEEEAEDEIKEEEDEKEVEEEEEGNVVEEEMETVDEGETVEGMGHLEMVDEDEQEAEGDTV